jgi:hypothetical protein
METVKKNIYIPFYHSKVLDLNAQGWFVKVKFLITMYFQTITGFVKKKEYFSWRNKSHLFLIELTLEQVGGLPFDSLERATRCYVRPLQVTSLS